jgi:hypothetical protein
LVRERHIIGVPNAGENDFYWYRFPAVPGLHR